MALDSGLCLTHGLDPSSLSPGATFGQVPVQQASGQFTTLSAPPTGVLPVFGGGVPDLSMNCPSLCPSSYLVNLSVSGKPSAGPSNSASVSWACN